MNELYQIYRCEICGTTIEVIHGGKGQLCCCGQGMRYYVENFFDRQRESHVPVVEKIPDGVRVRVGSVPHPMEKSHFIEWIEIIAEGKTARQFYRPGQAPEAIFDIKNPPITVRQFCNLHGLWKGYLIMSEKKAEK